MTENDWHWLCVADMTGDKKPRLVNGFSRCSGRVELHSGGQWHTVCGAAWNMDTANVVCEQLQCGAAVTAEAGAHVGNGSEIIWKSHYECRGNETQLWDCPVGSWDQITCTHEDDVSVTCSSEYQISYRSCMGCETQAEPGHVAEVGKAERVMALMWSVEPWMVMLSAPEVRRR
uniref:SRCR domain-containing protein n=1 Tax=Callorhinchus milii TaxID=7868 RepID=A0A4W3GF07_CALMI